MGMFDYIRISPSLLPVAAEERKKLLPSCVRQFQTKSFHQCLSIIHITREGKLRWLDYILIPDEDINLEDGEEISEVADCIPFEEYWVEEPDYTGTISFYNGVNGIWYEFEAVFTDGRLQKIVQHSPKEETTQ